MPCHAAIRSAATDSSQGRGHQASRLSRALQRGQVPGPGEFDQVGVRESIRQDAGRGPEERQVVMPDDHRDRGGDPSQVHGQVTVRALVTGRDLQVEGTTLHIPQQRPVVVVRVGPEPGVDHEVGRAGKVTDLDQGLLLPPDLAEGLVGLDEVSGRVQEDQPLNTVGTADATWSATYPP
jgi:hypothetical protein